MAIKNYDIWMKAFVVGQPVIEIDLHTVKPGQQPFIVIKDGPIKVIVDPIVSGRPGYLCVDLHPFVNGELAYAAPFVMSDGLRDGLGQTEAAPGKVAGWNAGRLAAVLIGDDLLLKGSLRG
jgi:hypothetical protein